MLEPIVRRARGNDRAALVEIYRQGIEAVHPERPSPPNWADEFERETMNECVFAAELPGAGIVGMLSVWEEDSFIHHLYIDARYRRRGLGAQLLADVTRRLPRPFLLKCLARNQGALAFYRREGWVEVGTEGAPDGDCILMQLS